MCQIYKYFSIILSFTITQRLVLLTNAATQKKIALYFQSYLYDELTDFKKTMCGLILVLSQLYSSKHLETDGQRCAWTFFLLAPLATLATWPPWPPLAPLTLPGLPLPYFSQGCLVPPFSFRFIHGAMGALGIVLLQV